MLFAIPQSLCDISHPLSRWLISATLVLFWPTALCDIPTHSPEESSRAYLLFIGLTSSLAVSIASLYDHLYPSYFEDDTASIRPLNRGLFITATLSLLLGYITAMGQIFDAKKRDQKR